MEKASMEFISSNPKINPEALAKIISNIPNLGTSQLVDNFKLEKEEQIKKAIAEELTLRLEGEKDEGMKNEIIEIIIIMNEEGTKFEQR